MKHPIFERSWRNEYRTRDGRFEIQRIAGRYEIFEIFREYGSGFELRCYRATVGSLKRARAYVI